MNKTYSHCSFFIDSKRRPAATPAPTRKPTTTTPPPTRKPTLKPTPKPTRLPSTEDLKFVVEPGGKFVFTAKKGQRVTVDCTGIAVANRTKSLIVYHFLASLKYSQYSSLQTAVLLIWLTRTRQNALKLVKEKSWSLAGDFKIHATVTVNSTTFLIMLRAVYVVRKKDAIGLVKQKTDRARLQFSFKVPFREILLCALCWMLYIDVAKI